MEKEKLRKKIFAKINTLPALPIVIPKLLNLLDEEETRAAQIVDTVSHDPALTSKILQVANSAYYGFPQEITSLDRAITLLGFNMVKSLALSIGVIHTLPSRPNCPRFSHEDLWIHCLAVATLMRHLGQQFRRDGEEPETFFTIGLLHDIGKIVLDQFFAEEFQKTLELVAKGEALPFHDAEKRAIGIDHGETGALLLSRWRFPDVVVRPILAHHQEGGINDETIAASVAFLRISDFVAQDEGVGSGGNVVPLPVKETDMALLGMNEEVLADAVDFLRNVKEGIYAFYQAMR